MVLNSSDDKGFLQFDSEDITRSSNFCDQHFAFDCACDGRDK